MSNYYFIAKVISGILLVNTLIGCVSAGSRTLTAKYDDCNNEKLMKSIKGTTKKLLTFKNNTNETVKIFWLDYNGQRKLYTDLQANKEVDQITYATHPWVIADEANKCIYLLPNATSENEVFEMRSH